MSKKILLTGGFGFLGKHTYDAFKSSGYDVVRPFRFHDLTSRFHCEDILRNFDPDVVVHLAAAVGGIEANQSNPGAYFYKNIIMGAEMMDATRRHNPKIKYVQVGTSCSYPKNGPSRPLKETDLWQGEPNEVTGPYGVAKLALITMARAYRKQYGMNTVTLIPVNLYGPGDTFDETKSHVIPAIIKKCLKAKQTGEEVVLWGSGKATREFLFVKDCARALVLAVEKFDSSEPINLGTGKEITIKEVAESIAELTGYSKPFVWDASKPEGQTRRVFNVEKAKQELGFEARTTFKEGLRQTIDWYLTHEATNSNS